MVKGKGTREMYKCRYFEIYELVSEKLYRKHESEGTLWKLWLLFDERVLKTADKIRERKGRMTCNDWWWDGERQYSGLRQKGDPYYSETSQHPYGRGLDLIPEETTPEDVRNDIRENPEEYPHVKGLEKDVNWVHFDTRNADKLIEFSA